MEDAPSFADVVQKKKELLVIDILPDGEGAPMLTEAHCKIIKNSFTKALFEAEEIADLDFEFAGFDKGRLRVVCENAISKDWIINTLPKLSDLWKDAKLKYVDAGAPPRLYRTTFSLQYPPPEAQMFFQAIERQNRLIDTSYWRLYNRKRGLNDKQNWIIGIDEKSVIAIKATNYRVKFGMDKIRFSVENISSNELSK